MCVQACQLKGFSADAVTTFEEMKQLTLRAAHLGYLMDLNLGNSGSRHVQQAQEIYALVHPRVVRAEAFFLGVSGNYGTLEAARNLGIPSENKPFNIQKFLDQCQSISEPYTQLQYSL